MYIHIMDLLFLISSETGEGEQGNRIIQAIASHGHPVIALVKDFEGLAALHNQFHTTVIFIVIDVNRSKSSLTKILSILPAINYIVNFPGVTVLNSDNPLTSLYRDRERERSELAFDNLAKRTDEKDCRILVSVVDHRSELKKKSSLFNKTLGNLVNSAKKKVGNSSRQENDDDMSEEAPLLPEAIPSSDEPGFLSLILSLICPCFCKAPETEYSFDNPEQLRAHIRSEQIAEINQQFRTLHRSMEARWEQTSKDLQRQEATMIEELTMRVAADRDQRMSTASEQNQNTRENLSGVLKKDTLDKLQQSRTRQAKDAPNRNFLEGRAQILHETSMERAQLRERHYNNLIETQIKKLDEIKAKYRSKHEALYKRYFENTNA